MECKLKKKKKKKNTSDTKTDWATNVYPSAVSLQMYDLNVTLPGLKTDTQTVQICLLPGRTASILFV